MKSFFLIAILAIVSKSGDGLKKLLRTLFGWKYKLYIVDSQKVPETGGLLLVGNHQSFIDWVFVILATERSVKFVIAEQYYNIFFLKPIFRWAGLVPISIRSSKRAISKVVKTLNNGEAIAIFPEGQLTRNGHLGQFKKGFELIARSADCVIVPFYIHGLWGSFFSHCNSYYRLTSKKQFKRKVYIGFGDSLDKHSTADAVKQKVVLVSALVMRRVSNDLQTVPVAWLKKAKRSVAKTSLINFDGKKYTNSKIIIAVLLFTEKIRKLDASNKRVGVLLPSSSGAVITNLAVLALGKTVVNLNYTSSADVISHCVQSAEVRTVYTSRVFLERLKQRGLDVDAALEGTKVVMLEDISKGMDKKQLAKMALKVLGTTTSQLIEEYFEKPALDDEAAILFSSGSEDSPKGIVLSHRNIAVNIHQVSLLLAQKKSDCLLNSLPPFHAFGLTITMFTPLVEGMKQVCAPDPTDAQSIGKFISNYKCTVIFATSTFANIYSRSKKFTREQLESVRLMVLGAEKLREEVRINFESKFGKKMYEGFGTTECSPVISVNLPDYSNKKDGVLQVGNIYGTVGQSVPGTACIIVDPETDEELPLGEAGLLLVSGPQVMIGYDKMPDKSRAVKVEKYGLSWYKTGDKAKITADGYIQIVDRYSRFAKVGGEMISLTMVEDQLMKIIRDAEIEISAVAIPDSNKGEIIVLLIAKLTTEIEHITSLIQKSDLHGLYRPKRILKVDDIPKLGSGKIDFSTTKKLVHQMMNNTD